MQKLYLSCLRGVIGDWVYYPCLMKLRDIAERVSLAKEIYESDTLSDLVQRELKTKRGRQIKDYLLTQQQRFFNSIIVGVHEGEPNWFGITHIESKKELKVAEVPDEVIESIGILRLSGQEKLFTLDGQHRLVGIKQAVRENRDLGEEEITVIFIAHRTDKKGKERSRRLFTTLNKNAKPVSKGEIIALDEDDTMAIVVRRLVREHPLFNKKRISNNATPNLPQNDYTSLTTIVNLYDLLNILFIKILGKNRKRERDRLTKMRLEDEKIQWYYDKTRYYFDLLVKNFRPLEEFLGADDYPRIVQKYRHGEGGNILFRPIGLSIITELVAILTKKQSLEKSVKNTSKVPLELSEVPYTKIIWQPAKQNIISKGKNLAVKLLLYMLGEDEEIDCEELVKEYANMLDVPKTDVVLPEKL